MKKLFVLALIAIASVSAASAQEINCADLKAKSDKGDAAAQADYKKAVDMGKCSEAGENL